jgi:hypothetical protein
VPAGIEPVDVFPTSFMQVIMPGLHSTYAISSCQGENKSSRNASRDFMRNFPLPRSGKRIQRGIRGRGKWIMDYEIAFDGVMTPEVRESQAAQRLAEEGE